MQELLDWYNDKKSGLHPIALSAIFHHKFVLIHPFDDGNGRISRLMMNFILLRFGYPPLVIRSVDKTKYLNALRLADVGDREAFIDYIADQVIWSLEISIKAAKGESIEEPNDWEKELSILAKSNDTIPERKTLEVTVLRFMDSFFPLFRAIKEKAEGQLNHLFEQVQINILLDNRELNAFLQNEHANFDNLKINVLKEDHVQILSLKISLLRYKKNKLDIFDINNHIQIKINTYQYEITFAGNKELKLNKLYSEKLSDQEIETIVNEWGKQVVDEIKKNIK